MEFVSERIDKIEGRAGVCDVYTRINIPSGALDQFFPLMYNNDMLVSRTGMEFTHRDLHSSVNKVIVMVLPHIGGLNNIFRVREKPSQEGSWEKNEDITH